MPDKPEPRYTREIARSRLFRIEGVGLAFSNGTQVKFERVASNNPAGAVLAVPITTAGEVLMIREYAVGTDRYELALPEGNGLRRRSNGHPTARGPGPGLCRTRDHDYTGSNTNACTATR